MKLKYIKIFMFVIFSLAVFIYPAHNVKAVEACRTRLGNATIYWDEPGAQVNKAKGDKVRIFVSGEQGCQGLNATFKIYKDGQLVSGVTPQGPLQNYGKYKTSADYLFFIDWAITLDKGNYKAQLASFQGGTGGGAKQTSNILTVTEVQACNLIRVPVDPKIVPLGGTTNLSVEASGQCNGWKAVIDVFNETKNKKVATLSAAFSGTSANITIPYKAAEVGIYHFEVALGNQRLKSSQFFVNAVSEITYACVDGNGKYACSPGSKQGCSDQSRCVGRAETCKPLDKALCDKLAPVEINLPNKTYACVDNNGKYSCSPSKASTCTDAPGCGGKNCIPLDINKCGTKPESNIIPQDIIKPGEALKTSFKLTPPPGLPTSIEEFVGDIIDFIFNISIPIAVILIIVSGIIMLTSAGNMARVGKARTILWYTVLGLAIIFIGKGFITLVTSILGGR